MHVASGQNVGKSGTVVLETFPSFVVFVFLWYAASQLRRADRVLVLERRRRGRGLGKESERRECRPHIPFLGAV